MTINAERKDYLTNLFLKKKEENIHIHHWHHKLLTTPRNQLIAQGEWLFIEELLCLAKEVLLENDIC